MGPPAPAFLGNSFAEIPVGSSSLSSAWTEGHGASPMGRTAGVGGGSRDMSSGVTDRELGGRADCLQDWPFCPDQGAHLCDECFGIDCGFRIHVLKTKFGTVSATRASEHLPALRAGGHCWSLRGVTDFRKHRDPESPSRYHPTASRSEAHGWRGPADVHRPPGPEWAAGQKQILVGESSWPWAGGTGRLV